MFEKNAFPVIDLAETGRCIERQRRLAGLTVRDLQTYFGFEYPQAIYKWQHGECLPTVDNLLALARILRVSMEDLLVYKDQEVFHFLLIWGLALCPGTVPLSCVHRMFIIGSQFVWRARPHYFQRLSLP